MSWYNFVMESNKNRSRLGAVANRGRHRRFRTNRLYRFVTHIELGWAQIQYAADVGGPGDADDSGASELHLVVSLAFLCPPFNLRYGLAQQ